MEISVAQLLHLDATSVSLVQELWSKRSTDSQKCLSIETIQHFKAEMYILYINPPLSHIHKLHCNCIPVSQF